MEDRENGNNKSRGPNFYAYLFAGFLSVGLPAAMAAADGKIRVVPQLAAILSVGFLATVIGRLLFHRRYGKFKELAENDFLPKLIVSVLCLVGVVEFWSEYGLMAVPLGMLLGFPAGYILVSALGLNASRD